MSIAISQTPTDVMVALRTFLIAVLPTGTEVVQALGNGVAMPKGGFVYMTHTGQERLSTNIVNYDTAANTKIIEVPTKHIVQLDFYGSAAGDWVDIVQALFRDEAGLCLFPPTVVPLYAENATELALATGEETYLQRWKLTAVMQFNPVITLGQDFANHLSVDLKNVDVTYMP